MKEKNLYIQWIRGFCIIMVILIHCKNGSAYPEQSFEYNYGIIMRQFINFPVAVFIFISGYLTKLGDNVKWFNLHRLKRLIIPYMVWSVIYILIKICNGWDFSIVKSFALIIIGQASGHLYFIIVMLQLTLLLPIIKKIDKCKYGKIILFSITPIYYLIMYIGYALGFNIPFRTTLFPAWFIYFYLGIYVNDEGGYKKLFRQKYIPIFIAIILSIIEAQMFKTVKQSYDLAITQVKISSMCYSVAVINLIIHNINNKISINNIIYKIGN